MRDGTRVNLPRAGGLVSRHHGLNDPAPSLQAGVQQGGKSVVSAPTEDGGAERGADAEGAPVIEPKPLERATARVPKSASRRRGKGPRSPLGAQMRSHGIGPESGIPVEIDRTVILNQVANGVSLRMAALDLLAP